MLSLDTHPGSLPAGQRDGATKNNPPMFKYLQKQDGSRGCRIRQALTSWQLPEGHLPEAPFCGVPGLPPSLASATATSGDPRSSRSPLLLPGHFYFQVPALLAPTLALPHSTGRLQSPSTALLRGLPSTCRPLNEVEPKWLLLFGSKGCSQSPSWGARGPRESQEPLTSPREVPSPHCPQDLCSEVPQDSLPGRVRRWPHHVLGKLRP